MNIHFLRTHALWANEALINLTLLENQGYNNTNYLLEGETHNYLVRVFGKNSLDRKREFEVGKKAFAKGISQKPLLLDSTNGFMVVKFAKGVHHTHLRHRQLQGLARKLRTLHRIKWRQKPYDLTKDYTSYSKESLKNRVFQTNLLFKKLKKLTKEPVLCHHDLNPKNILFHHHAITFIDWEYARVNDRYFDLASIVVEFGLDPKETHLFLRTYFTCKEKIDFKKLELYKKAYSVLCEMWLDAYFRDQQP